MIVVSDASPVNYLCRIGQIDILHELFSNLVIPLAVAGELSRPSTPEVVRRFIASPPTWVSVRRPNTIDRSLEHFGIGEKEAISLAIESGADLVLIDDKAARRAAKARGLSVVGTLGLLKLAAGRNLLNLHDSVTQLQAIGFYVSEEVIDELFEQQSESPPSG